jgi:uncharacterized protein (TIGR02996 family)
MSAMWSGKRTPLMVLGAWMWRYAPQAQHGRTIVGAPRELLLEALAYCTARAVNFLHRTPNHHARSGFRFYGQWAALIMQELNEFSAQSAVEARLITAITNGDCTARAVYADMLEERGDLFHAKLIMLKCGKGYAWRMDAGEACGPSVPPDERS